MAYISINYIVPEINIILKLETGIWSYGLIVAIVMITLYINPKSIKIENHT